MELSFYGFPRSMTEFVTVFAGESLCEDRGFPADSLAISALSEKMCRDYRNWEWNHHTENLRRTMVLFPHGTSGRLSSSVILGWDRVMRHVSNIRYWSQPENCLARAECSGERFIFHADGRRGLVGNASTAMAEMGGQRE